jgi:hypothetical protein
MLRVIEGGLSEGPMASAPADGDVRREAALRLREAGYDEAAARSFVTGRPMPEALRYLKLQIDFAAAALQRLNPVPSDFRDAKYWPG